MSEKNIAILAQESFKRKLKALSELKAVEDAAFADAVYTALSRFGVDERSFRDAFGLSSGAVERWTQLKNLPQPNVRPKIIAWILHKL
jgi:hypothetical protein